MATEKRLIDANDALKRLKKAEQEMMVVTMVGCKAVPMYGVIEFIETRPTVDAVEVVHGRWEEADDGDGVVCSVCREDFCNIYLETDRFNYCPNCGAKMDEEP